MLTLETMSHQFNGSDWVICSTPHALIPDALSPHTLSPCSLSPNGLINALQNQEKYRSNF